MLLIKSCKNTFFRSEAIYTNRVKNKAKPLILNRQEAETQELFIIQTSDLSVTVGVLNNDHAYI